MIPRAFSPRRAVAVIALASAGLAASGEVIAETLNDRVVFPDAYQDGVHYGSVRRGGIREELYASLEAIEAARAGDPFPDGTVITMEDHRDGGLYRYVVMEKRAGWGALSSEDVRAGDWLFRVFAPDGAPDLSDDGTRCMACHQSQAAQDYVFTVDQMRAR